MKTSWSRSVQTRAWMGLIDGRSTTRWQSATAAGSSGSVARTVVLSGGRGGTVAVIVELVLLGAMLLLPVTEILLRHVFNTGISGSSAIAFA